MLLRLATMTGQEAYARKAVALFRLLRDSLKRYGSAFGRLLCALDFHLSTPKEIAVVGAAGGGETRALLRVVWARYLPNKIVAQADEGDARAAELVPLLRERPMIGGRATAYVCEHYACQQPVTSPEELGLQLSPASRRDASGGA